MGRCGAGTRRKTQCPMTLSAAKLLPAPAGPRSGAAVRRGAPTAERDRTDVAARGAGRKRGDPRRRGGSGGEAPRGTAESAVTTFALVGSLPRARTASATRRGSSSGALPRRNRGSAAYKIAQGTQGSSSSRGVMALFLRCLPPPTRLGTRGWHSSPAARDARGRPQAVGVFCPKELTARRRAS